MPTDERVLVIPTARLHAAGDFQGFRSSDVQFQSSILDPRHYQFRIRSEVETDPSFKQLIPYLVIHCAGELFHYRRGSAGTEKRLVASRSIGVGGHISEEDSTGGAGDPYRVGMLRELHEEVEIASTWRELFLGFINDDRTPVGRVHLGVVHLFELDSPSVSPRETAIASPGFSPLRTLLASSDDFESWSVFVLEELQQRWGIHSE